MLRTAPITRHASQAEAAESLTLALGSALHAAGAPAHDVEAAMTRVARTHGLDGRFFATPTAIQAAFGPSEAQHASFARVEPGEVALGRLAALDAVVEGVVSGQLSVPAARRELDALRAAPAPWSERASVLASIVIGPAAACFFGGGVGHMALAAGIAAVVRLLEITLARRGEAARLTLLVGAAVSTVFAVLGARAFALGTAWPALLGGVIQLAPGYTLTVAAIELGAGQLQSGTARLASAATSFLQLALGIAAPASALGAWASGELVAAHAVDGPAPWFAAAVAGLGFTVRLQAAPRDAGRVTAGAIAGYAAYVFASRYVGGWWAPLVAAAVLSAASELAARRAGRPAVLTLVPGILMLVPGGAGLGSLSMILRDDADAGVTAALGTVLAAFALGSGVSVGAMLVRGRR